VKYFKRMEEIRGKEPYDGVEPEKDFDTWSDTSSHQSMFKGTMVKQNRGAKTGPAKRQEAPAITEICARIGEYVASQTVQDACTHKPQPGTKYMFYGGGQGGGITGDQWKRNSREDPWNFPAPKKA